MKFTKEEENLIKNYRAEKEFDSWQPKLESEFSNLEKIRIFNELHKYACEMYQHVKKKWL